MPDTNVGRGVYQLAADRTQLGRDLQAASGQIKATGDATEKQFADAAGQGMSRIGGLVKLGVTAVATGAGAMFGVATKGAIELDNATAKFQATTGATAEEATKAGHAIAEMSRGNLQGIAAIGDVLGLVTANMHLTGDAAVKTTQQILDWATATGQDATTATKDWDDVLDSWHLTADQLPGLMDQLIAGTQKYGGSVSGAEAAVTALAPAIQGLGGDFSDATGFVNLFESAGLDASSAARGLQTAIKNLKPGQTLDDLVKQVSSIEDPIKRAQEAARIFGTRAGAQLANALQPGITSLDQFNVSAGDAAGSTQEAADAIKGTFSNQVKLAIQNITGALAELGSQFGPALTGFASLATLMGPTLAGVFTKLGGDTVIKTAAGAAGGAIGLVFSGAVFVAEQLIGLAVSAFNLLGRAREMLGAAGMAGTLAGTAFQLAFVGGIALLGAAVADKLHETLSDSIGDFLGGDFKRARPEQVAAVQALATQLGVTFNEAVAAVVAAGGETDFNKAVATVMQNGIQIAETTGTATGQRYAGAMAAATTDYSKTWVASAATVVTDYANTWTASAPAIKKAVAESSYEAGSALDNSMAAGIREHADTIAGAAKTIRDLISNGISPKQEAQKALGAKAVNAFRDGMHSRKIGVVETTKDLLLATLAEFEGKTHLSPAQAKHLATLKGIAFANGISSQDIAAEKAGCRVTNAAKDGTDCISLGTWRSGGSSLSKAWGSGFVGTLAQVRADAERQVHAIGNMFIPSSPIKEGPLKGIEKAGGIVFGKWGAGAIAAVEEARQSIGEALAAPGIGAAAFALTASSQQTVRHEHSGRVQVELSGATIAGARAQGASWEDIGSMAALVADAAATAHLRYTTPRRFS